MIRNKKGIFFTTLVIVILLLFILTLTLYSNIKERKTIQKRIETLNSLVFSIEENIPRQLRTAGFRIIFLFEKRIAETGSYISDVEGGFQEAFFEGTIYGDTNTEIETVMAGATFQDILTSLKEKAANVNVDIDIINPSIHIKQSDPWYIEVTLSSNLIIKDKGGLALWNKTANITAYTPIENLEDPFYLINTNGLVSNKIFKTPYLNFVQGSDISNLSLHSTNSYYIASTTAPSFLNRLQGINAQNANGIESLVNLNKLSLQGIQIKDKSIVDYIYFSNSNPSACNVLPAGMPSWFKLDQDHESLYQVTLLPPC